MSRGACAHAWSAGDLGGWLQVRGVEAVEDLVDLDASELGVVGECLLDGCDGFLALSQEFLAGPGDEVVCGDVGGCDAVEVACEAADVADACADGGLADSLGSECELEGLDRLLPGMGDQGEGGAVGDEVGAHGSAQCQASGRSRSGELVCCEVGAGGRNAFGGLCRPKVVPESSRASGRVLKPGLGDRITGTNAK